MTKNSSSEILSTFANNYIEYLNNVKSDIERYCRKDEDISRLIEILYNKHEKDSLEYHMHIGLHKILSALGEDSNLNESNYYWGFSHYNVLENILRFIEKHIDTCDKEQEFITSGLYLKLKHKTDGTVDIFVHQEEFNTGYEMEDNGYVNKAGDILFFLEDYAKEKMNEKK